MLPGPKRPGSRMQNVKGAACLQFLRALPFARHARRPRPNHVTLSKVTLSDRSQAASCVGDGAP